MKLSGTKATLVDKLSSLKMDTSGNQKVLHQRLKEHLDNLSATRKRDGFDLNKVTVIDEQGKTCVRKFVSIGLETKDILYAADKGGLI